MMNNDVVECIKQALGPAGWIDEVQDMAPYLADMRGIYTAHTALVARPKSAQEVAAVVTICAGAGVGIVPQGGNTGLVGGSVPSESGDEILLSLGRMNKVRSLDSANNTITVEAGCVLADIQAAAARAERLFPLSLAAEGSCQIGGNLSTNAGGTGVLRYGNARDLALGLEVVLPDGSLWDGLKGLRKDNSGYDLKQLFIGGEGTLGVITAAVLKIFPAPRDTRTALAAVPDIEAAMELFARAREAAGETLTACETLPRIAIDFVLRHLPECRDPLAEPHPWYVLIELTATSRSTDLAETLETLFAETLEAGIVRDGTIAATGEQARQLWRLREGIAEVQKHEGASIKHDVSLPLSRVADFITEAIAAVEARLPGVRPLAFGHLGDGNIHFNLAQPVGADGDEFLARREEFYRIVHDIAEAMDGSFSAEHGIGRMRRGELEHYRTDVELNLMRKIKATLDPQGIMNPGKLVDGG
ncbi:MAG: FAD-binding oxidoreductase [Alphaproteobacteria bacterium]